MSPSTPAKWRRSSRDAPLTAAHAQRDCRIDRLGQRHPEIRLVDLRTDTPFEVRAQDRIERKYVLRDLMLDPAGLVDDSGLAAAFTAARQRAAAAAQVAA